METTRRFLPCLHPRPAGRSMRRFLALLLLLSCGRYVVPVNVLEHFLEDVRRHKGRYLGFPRLGITHQHLESPALRGSLRMSPEQTGVMVTGVQVRDGVNSSTAVAGKWRVTGMCVGDRWLS